MKAIYTRLGFRKGVTELSPVDRDRIASTIHEAAGIVQLKGAACMLDSTEMEGGRGIELEDGTVFSSRDLAKMLSGCGKVLLMGATAGQDIMDAIASASSSDQFERAVILDAVASELADTGLDWIVDYMNQDLIRRSWRVTKARFSAGYGDFSLENQKAMHGLLRLDAIGVSITDRCILVPEKSVTAVAGIMAHA